MSLRKPDLIGVRNGVAVLIDSQVVSDGADLNELHYQKKAYYEYVKICTATLSWRGIWSSQSLSGLSDLGAIGKRDIKVLSSRVVIGGLAAWNIFNKRTTIRRAPDRRK